MIFLSRHNLDWGQQVGAVGGESPRLNQSRMLNDFDLKKMVVNGCSSVLTRIDSDSMFAALRGRQDDRV